MHVQSKGHVCRVRSIPRPSKLVWALNLYARHTTDNQWNQENTFENHPDATPTPRNNGTKSQHAIPPCFINWPSDNSRKKTFIQTFIFETVLKNQSHFCGKLIFMENWLKKSEWSWLTHSAEFIGRKGASGIAHRVGNFQK